MLRNISQLQEDGYDNFVCYFTPRNDTLDQFNEAGIRVACLGHAKRSHGMRTLFRLIRLMRGLDIDLVHTNLALDGFYCRIAAKLLGVPTVSTLHHTVKPPRLKISDLGKVETVVRFRLHNIGARLLTRRFIAVSKAVRDIHVKYHSFPDQRIDVVYSGIDTEQYCVDPESPLVDQLRNDLGVEAADPLLINVGRLNQLKGQRYLVKMMALVREKLPKVQLLIVGEGEERRSLEQEIKRLGLESSISLLGQRYDIPYLLAASDIFVFPSLGEGQPLSLIEAMASGKPIITSRIPEIAEIISEGITGCMVEPRDSSALAQCLLRFHEDGPYALRLGKNARKVAFEEFSSQLSVKHLRLFYDSVLQD